MKSIYTMVTKVLATRLELVMEILISPDQSSFCKGKMLVDEVVAIKEVVDLTKRSKIVCLIFKVDFRKGHDPVV